MPVEDDQSKTDQTQYNIVLLPLIFTLLWIKYIAKLKLDLKMYQRGHIYPVQLVLS
jgi:hypothetical protein